MNDIRDLKKQLEALGGAPVPAARPEFRQALLARLLDDAPVAVDGLVIEDREPIVVHQLTSVSDLSRRRRSRVLAMQAAAAISIAAAAAGVLGVVSLVDNGGKQSPPDGVASAAAQLASEPGALANVTITDKGELLDAAGKPAEIKDGSAEMTCADDMHFRDIHGQTYSCVKDQVVEVIVLDNGIASTDAQVVVEVKAINLHKPAQSQPLSWSWDRYEGNDFDHYELVRVNGLSEKGADLSGYAVVTRTASGDVAATSFTEGSDLQQSSTYQLRVVTADGTLLAHSGLIKVTISD